jgi:deoxyribose-phosphate aldolase
MRNDESMRNEQIALQERIAAKIQDVLATPSSVSVPVEKLSVAQIAGLIDHTLLKPEATEEQISELCQQALEYHFGAVCVNPAYVALCRKLLHGSDVQIACVAGFPLGATLPEVKAYEAQRSIVFGATEVDMVLNVGALKSQAYVLVRQDVATVAQACHAKGAILKVIIEAALLSEDEKIAACFLAQEAGADFVKTSTGFGPGGAKAEDVALMRRTVGPNMGIKAAGGIRTYRDALAMIGAGATRIGASAGIKIVQEARAEGAT